MKRSAVASLGLAVLTIPSLATEPATQVLREVGNPNASSSAIARGNVPWNKSWQELTPDEQKIVRNEYKQLAPTDEPPYPVGGLRALHRPVAEAYQSVGSRAGTGPVLMVVQVDDIGKATKVEVYKTLDDRRFTRFMASTLMKARYKPAVCNGSPCAMPFVFTADMTLE